MGVGVVVSCGGVIHASLWWDTCTDTHVRTLVKLTWDLLGTGVLVETRSPRFGRITSAAVSDDCACGCV